MARKLILLLTVAGATWWARPARAGDAVSAGPLWADFALTIEPGERTEAFGPLWAQERRWPEEGRAGPDAPEPPVSRIARTFTLAPLFNWNAEPAVERVSWDLAYPVITYDRYGPEWRLQVLQLLRFTGGATQDAARTRSFTLFPFFWFRRSAENTALNYGAVWPFYGMLQHRLFRDEIRFVLWPAYVQTRRRDVVTDNYLVPFVHTRRGEGMRGWQVWPFYGTERKFPTARTNGFGELETVPGYERRFVLWPFYSAADLGLGSTNPVTQRALLPFYSREHSPQKDRELYGWPFGPVFVEDRALGYRQTSFLFPVFTFAHGAGKQAARVWPLYGTTRYAESRSVFAAWPLYSHKDTWRDPLERHATRIGFFLYTDVETRDRRTGRTGRRSDLWPLFLARRDAEGHERFQMLAVLEPLLPENTSIRRLYSPLWALWRSEKNPRAGTASRSFLWNLYRHETRPEGKKRSLLFGLFQYQSTPDGPRWRLFYLPLGRRAAPAGGPPAGGGAPSR